MTTRQRPASSSRLLDRSGSVLLVAQRRHGIDVRGAPRGEGCRLLGGLGALGRRLGCDRLHVLTSGPVTQRTGLRPIPAGLPLRRLRG